MARSPRAAIAATIGAPSFPKPMTLTLIGMTLPETMWPSGRLRGETKMPAQALLQHTQERRGHPPKIPFLHIYAHTCFSGPYKFGHNRASTCIHAASIERRTLWGSRPSE